MVSQEIGFRAYNYALQSAARALLPNERVADCLRKPSPGAQLVHIKKHSETAKTRYGNILVCSRVWQCPICAYTVSEVKRKRLTAVVAKCGGYPVMVTLTIRHHAYTLLKALLDALIKAYHKVTAGAPYVRFTQKWGVIAYIRALEVTWGASNGWHPHLHVIFILQNELLDEQIDDFRAWFVERWLLSLSKFGFDGDELHAVDVKAGDFYVKEYIAKFGRLPRDPQNWTLEKELVRGHYKTSNGDERVTPFGLLDAYLFSDNAQAGALFREYSEVFKGRKQLQASKGFWALGGFDAASDDDEQIAQELDNNPLDEIFLSLDLRQWRFVLDNNIRGELLDVAQSATSGQVVLDWLVAVGLSNA